MTSPGPAAGRCSAARRRSRPGCARTEPIGFPAVAASSSRSTTSAGSTSPASAGSASATSTTWPRSRPTWLGPLIRSFGTLSVRRGESDREAVRRMREVVRDGNALAVFVEGTRQHSGVPGHVQPGAAMVAVQESVPVVCAAIHGSQYWKPGNFAPVSIAWGEPMRFDGLPRGGKGYREASAQIEAELYRLWAWLRDLHEAGRPRVAVPPGREDGASVTLSA